MTANYVQHALAALAACSALTAGAQSFFQGILLDRSFGTRAK